VHELQEERRVGLRYLNDVTLLLQRIRATHPTAGLYEAADLQWWWSQRLRPTNELSQLFWFDRHGHAQAAMIATDTGSQVQLDPIVMPDASPELVAHVMERGLAHASESGVESVCLEVDSANRLLREMLIGRGFVIEEGGLIETWLAADTRPEISPLQDGYRLSSRLDELQRPHHMIKRNGPGVESRLRETSLYRPDLDLVVYGKSDGKSDATSDATSDRVAAYGLFWFDPTTATGLVEPMRTEDDDQRRGLARHILASGIDMLVKTGAKRIKICFAPDNPASSHLYLSVGFKPDRRTILLAGPTTQM
jgi:GNAT superfamily N-acetyltransferase